MNAGNRHSPKRTQPPAVLMDERQAIVLQQFRQDLVHWIGENPRTATRVMRLVDEILRDPFLGVGKPEALKYGQRGRWSRRITESDRLVYFPQGTAVFFIAARHHYERS
jgi:toxin YoeB